MLRFVFPLSMVFQDTWLAYQKSSPLSLIVWLSVCPVSVESEFHT